MTRSTHLVGSWTARSPAQAMDSALIRLAPHLRRLSDGETGTLRSQWVQPTIEGLRANPDVELVAGLAFAGADSPEDYEEVPRFALREGHELRPDNLHLHYRAAFDYSFPQFLALRERYGRPDLPFQVGIPGPWELAAYAFGHHDGNVPNRLEAAFEDATVREIARIREVAGDDVIFQLEYVLPLLSVAGSPPEAQDGVATAMAAKTAHLVARCPEGTRFGSHLCLGDFKHKAMGHMTDARPLVLLANAIGAAWPAGRRLEYIHAPFAAAAEPPIADPAFYEPLADLSLPDGTRFVAGFIHESLGIDEHRELLHRIEDLVGTEVDVAAACGLARREEIEQVWDAMDKAIELINTGNDHADH